MEEYLTTVELGERLKMAPGTIRNMVCNGRLELNQHYVKVSERKLLFVWSAVEKWIYQKPSKRNNAKRKRLNPLFANRIRNIMITIQVIIRDAVDQYIWVAFHDPFRNLKLPPVKKDTASGHSPQSNGEGFLLDGDLPHIELSRVAGQEKTNLKTEDSQQSIRLRQSMKRILEQQRNQSAVFGSGYLFVNTEGNQINQFTLYD